MYFADFQQKFMQFKQFSVKLRLKKGKTMFKKSIYMAKNCSGFNVNNENIREEQIIELKRGIQLKRQ